MKVIIKKHIVTVVRTDLEATHCWMLSRGRTIRSRDHLLRVTLRLLDRIGYYGLLRLRRKHWERYGAAVREFLGTV